MKGGYTMASEAQKKAVREYEKRNDRINVIFPAGTRERIEKLNLNKSTSAFIKETVISEIEKLEKYLQK